MYSKFPGITYRFRRVAANFGIETIRRLSNPYKNNSSVFLVGCGRSGTNMLLRGLGKSYKVELYNESHPAAFSKWRLKDFTTINRLTASGYAQIKLYKPILDTHMAGEYLSKFPRAKIIFIYRHYSDIITSSIRKFGTDNWPSRVSDWIENDFAEFASAPPPPKKQKNIFGLCGPTICQQKVLLSYIGYSIIIYILIWG